MLGKPIALSTATTTAFVLLLLVSCQFRTSSESQAEPDIYTNLQGQHSLGIYNTPSGRGNELNRIPKAHLSVKWMNFDAKPIAKDWQTTIKSNLATLIRVETWAGYEHDPGHVNVLTDVVNGKYDSKINQLCADLAPFTPAVILTFDPEMEVPVKDFPWQYQSPQLYMQAFQHFAKLVKRANPGFKILWSTAGYPGLDEYWPGAEGIDAVGIVLNSRSASETKDYPKPASFAESVKRKLFRIRMMNKPVLFLCSQHSVADSSNMMAFTAALNNYRKETQTLNISSLPRNRPWTIRLKHDKLAIGVYDPRRLLVNEDAVSTEHVFADWGSVEDGTLSKSIDEANHRRHSIIVTLEPWRGIKWPADPNVLQNILAGHYDPIIKQTSEVIARSKNTVFLRFAHEMEIPIHRYTWQSQNPITYIKAYRHFMAFFTNQKNVIRIWGPAGDRGSLEWWPGNAWVDYISIAIYGLPDKNITDPLKQESFTTIFNRKQYRMRLVNKPLFITEFGVKGPASFQKAWLMDAANTIKNSSNVVGISYFNLADNPKAWGKIAPPNWGISDSTFRAFSAKLK